MKQTVYALGLASLLVACSEAAERQAVDWIIVNAHIYTVDSAFSKAEAMAVRSGKIIAVGQRSDIEASYRAERVFDAGGNYIYPGFYDAHCHFVGYAQSLAQADLTAAASIGELIERLKAFRAAHPHMPWLLGRGWDQNDWQPAQFPDRQALDSVFADVPVYLTRVDGHAAWVNSRALQVAGIEQAVAVEGGLIQATPDGKPTGILIDNAMRLVQRHIPEIDKQQLSLLLQEAEQHCFAAGLTTLCDAGLPLSHIRLIDSLQQSAKLRIRLYAMASADETNLAYFEKRGIWKTDRLHVRGFKIYADGALGSRGAYLSQHYHDAPEQKGFLLRSTSELDRIYRRILDMGFQANTHCIGDAANHAVLGLYAQYLKGQPDRRWRIEHAQVVAPADLPLFTQYGIIPSVQPTHATSDMYWASQRLGSERLAWAYAYRSLLEASGLLALGTDFPVESINPMLTFYAAVARKDLKGYPPEGFLAAQALSREQALRGMTCWAAYACFEEQERGSLEPGKQADFVVLDGDLMQVPIEAVPKVRVLATFLAGEKVYEAMPKAKE